MKIFPGQELWFSWRTIFLYLPVTLISVPVALTNTQVSLAQTLQITILLTLLSIGILALLVFSERLVPKVATLRWLIVIACGLGIGVVRGAALSLALESYLLADPGTVQTRIVSAAISTAIWLVALSVISSSIAHNRHRYQERFASQVIQRAASDSVPETQLAQQIDGLRNIKALKASLSQIATTARAESVSENQLLLAAAQLREQIENSLRPLSHRIWFNENLNRPQFRVLGLVAEALRKPWFFPWATSIAATMWFFAGAYGLGPTGPVLLKALTSGVLLLATLSLAKKVLDTTVLAVWQGAAVMFGISGLSHGLSDLLVWAITGQSWVQDPISNFLFLSLFVAAVLLIASSLRVLSSDLELLDLMLDEISVLENEQVRTRFAGYLHNSLQAELTSLALRLEEAAKKDKNSMAEAVSKLEEIANRSFGEDFTLRNIAPEERLARVISGWEGIASVQVDVCAELKTDKAKFALFVELVEEAIANSVRHGKSKSLEVSTKQTADGIEVSLSNQVSNSPATKSGLGEAWIQRYAKSVDVSVEDTKRTVRLVL